MTRPDELDEVRERVRARYASADVQVGPAGKAYGLDMTDEMLDLAKANAAEAGDKQAVLAESRPSHPSAAPKAPTVSPWQHQRRRCRPGQRDKPDDVAGPPRDNDWRG